MAAKAADDQKEESMSQEKKIAPLSSLASLMLDVTRVHYCVQHGSHTPIVGLAFNIPSRPDLQMKACEACGLVYIVGRDTNPSTMGKGIDNERRQDDRG